MLCIASKNYQHGVSSPQGLQSQDDISWRLKGELDAFFYHQQGRIDFITVDPSLPLPTGTDFQIHFLKRSTPHGPGKGTKPAEKNCLWTPWFWTSCDEWIHPSSGKIGRLQGFEKMRILYVAMAEKKHFQVTKSGFWGGELSHMLGGI